MSKIPESRFDRENPSTWFGSDPSQQLRDEIKFSRFTTRLQHIFAEILLKPIRIQLALQIPDIKNDKRILNSVGLHFNSYNQFVELMEEQIDMTRMEHIQSLRDTFITTDEDGNEEHYFSDEFLLVKYLKMSDADLELNAKYKAKEHALKKKAKENEENSEDNGGENTDELDQELGIENGGENTEETPEEENNNEIDSEMNGDVQPESEETTTA